MTLDYIVDGRRTVPVLPLVDLLDSALTVNVDLGGLSVSHVFAGRLVPPEVRKDGAMATRVWWWADELFEVLAACPPGDSRSGDLFGTTMRSDLAGIISTKQTFGGDVELSAGTRDRLFGLAPQYEQHDIQAMWEIWSKTARHRYVAHRKWALARTPDTPDNRLAVARFAAWRAELLSRKELA